MPQYLFGHKARTQSHLLLPLQVSASARCKFLINWFPTKNKQNLFIFDKLIFCQFRLNLQLENNTLTLGFTKSWCNLYIFGEKHIVPCHSFSFIIFHSWSGPIYTTLVGCCTWQNQCLLVRCDHNERSKWKMCTSVYCLKTDMFVALTCRSDQLRNILNDNEWLGTMCPTAKKPAYEPDLLTTLAHHSCLRDLQGITTMTQTIEEDITIITRLDKMFNITDLSHNSILPWFARPGRSETDTESHLRIKRHQLD
jgi:hypothetical protein